MKDVIILGGGPGGYVAAIRAAQLGLDVTVIEKNKLGGTCLNVGCIPTKTYVASSNLMEKIKKAKKFGIKNTSNPEIDFEALVKRKNRVVNRMVKGIEFIFNRRNIEFVNQKGFIVDRNTVRVGDEKLKAKNIIIATGSQPIIPKSFYSKDFTIDSSQALDLKKKIESVIIVGAGVVGCEFASIWADFGVEVNLVEMEDTILPFIGKDITKRMEKLLKRKGVKLFTGRKVDRVEGKKVILDNKKILSAEKMLLSIGRRPVLDNIGIENVDVNIDDDGFVQVDERMRAADNIYAIGDIVSSPQLAHVASKEGMVAVENISGKTKTLDYSSIPWTIFTNPEIAYVGKDEKEMDNPVIGKFPFRANGKALGADEAEGFVKIVADENNKVAGMKIIGPHASDLIHEGALAIKNGLSLEDVADTVHAHPTLGESVMEAAEKALGKAVHIV
ncbi:MAG: dihydrolipoyl dehydrogenase [Candidatus Mcinerneyibacterium aminivorans]|uniref:Dihydrolipoyl dehydrogenase n=1 Tax=Candidatus Mcinerneyibacterium aminivorans TaxID=2703815 RepID=A0A5D0MGP3_9BACT|nr:MAG: dihydrolipoyl dehydrogenase [Candidatus Mcinerneyibacterium aminivorans]